MCSCVHGAAADRIGRREDPLATAFIVPTGGTTGPHRAVVHTHRSIEIGAVAVSGTLSMGPDSRHLVVAPLTHAAGFFALSFVLNGGTNVNITTTSASPTDLGDITGNGTVTVTAANPGSLTLTADHAINYDGAIVSTNGPLAITLLSGKGGIGGIG